MNGFCSDCEYLKEGKQRGKHFCGKYNKFVRHLEHHKEIVRLEECVREAAINKPISKEEILQLLNSWQQIANETIKCFPCSKCLDVKYSFDGKELVKICDKDCLVIKQFEELYDNLIKICLKKLLVGD